MSGPCQVKPLFMTGVRHWGLGESDGTLPASRARDGRAHPFKSPQYLRPSFVFITRWTMH
jgi:hypothetical protein